MSVPLLTLLRVEQLPTRVEQLPTRVEQLRRVMLCFSPPPLSLALQGSSFSVVVTEGQPDATGLRMAKALAEHVGVPVTLVLDCGIAYIMETYAQHVLVDGCNGQWSTLVLSMVNTSLVNGQHWSCMVPHVFMHCSQHGTNTAH